MHIYSVFSYTTSLLHVFKNIYITKYKMWEITVCCPLVASMQITKTRSELPPYKLTSILWNKSSWNSWQHLCCQVCVFLPITSIEWIMANIQTNGSLPYKWML